MLMRIRNAGEDKEDEAYVSKKVLHRICDNKDHQYKEMRARMEHKLNEKNMEVGLHMHNEKQYCRIIKEKERLLYVVSGCCFFVGGLVGFICG